MNIYIIGCGGMLGEEVYNHFSKEHNIRATDIELTSPWIKYQNVRDYVSLSDGMGSFNPDVIMNLAAMTDLEECEENSTSAMETNAIGSANCAALASVYNIPYIYISTAGIFDGEQEYYDDYAAPNPLGWYAKSKYQGELFAQTTPKHIVLRCGWQSGGCEKDKKFINKIWKQIKNGATELNIVEDKLGCPTYTKDFTRQIEKMIDTESYGVWNAVCKGNASRYEVAVELVKLLNLQDKIKINIVPSSFWHDKYFAPRPNSEKLITSKLDAAGLNVMRHWKDCLKEYIIDNLGYFTLKNE